MVINRTYGFEGVEAELTVYNGQAILNLPVSYVLEDADGVETDYTFPGYQSSFLNVYDSYDRNDMIKTLTSQVTRNSNIQVINASVADMTFEANGIYYYELGYVRSGYDIVLRYGKLFVV